MGNRLSTWWRTLSYNYRWSDYVSYIDGWIPRFSFFFPFLGYLVLVNDEVSGLLAFTRLVGADHEWGLSGGARLRLLYYGLLFLGVSNFVYRLRRPFVLRFGTNLRDYTSTCLDLFTFGNFLDMHERIRQGHRTLDGKYYDSEWDGFAELAMNTGEGTDKVERDGDWAMARSRYGSLLRSILRETFFAGDIKRRGWLTLCLALSTVGYTLLAVPSVDLLLKVTRSTLGV